jgi:hypothetical protein
LEVIQATRAVVLLVLVCSDALTLMIPLSSIFFESVAALCGKTTRMGRSFLGTLSVTYTRRRKRGDFELSTPFIEAWPLWITSILCGSGTLFRGQAIKT